MHYSPKLKVVMEEIKKILSDNDITGFVVLHTPGFSEYLNHLEATYSCAKVTENGLMFRLISKEVGAEKAEEIAGSTYNMITHISEVMAEHTMVYIEAHGLLKTKWGGKEEKGIHTPHKQPG